MIIVQNNIRRNILNNVICLSYQFTFCLIYGNVMLLLINNKCFKTLILLRYVKLQMWETKLCDIVYLNKYVNVHSFLLRSSYHSFSGVSVVQSFVSVNLSVDHYHYSFYQCIVSYSVTFRFWLSLWYLQHFIIKTNVILPLPRRVR